MGHQSNKDCDGRIHVFLMFLKHIHLSTPQLNISCQGSVRHSVTTAPLQCEEMVEWNVSVNASLWNKRSRTPCHYIVSASDIQPGGSCQQYVSPLLGWDTTYIQLVLWSPEVFEQWLSSLFGFLFYLMDGLNERARIELAICKLFSGTTSMRKKSCKWQGSPSVRPSRTSMIFCHCAAITETSLWGDSSSKAAICLGCLCISAAPRCVL